MIEVVSLTAADGGDAIRIVFSVDGEEETYTVSAADHFLIGLRKGECDGEDYLSVKVAADRYSAVRAALRSIAAGQCSAKRLYVKLLQKKIRAADAQYAVRFVRGKGYIDERAQIESYLHEMIGRKHMGRNKVVPALLSKGYTASDIRRVLEENYSESDFAEAKKAFLLAKFGKTAPATPAEADEMKKALYKNGY